MEKKRILIVDDEKMYGNMVKLNLEKAGEFEVMVLLGGKEILEYLHKFEPHLILLDLIMPEIGGMEVCQMLNSDPVGSKTPIIVITALEKDADRLMAYKLGVVDYLVKPVEVTELIKAIKKALGAK